MEAGGGEQARKTDKKPPSSLPHLSGPADLGHVCQTSYYLKRTGKAVGPAGDTSQGLGGNEERAALKLWWWTGRTK